MQAFSGFVSTKGFWFIVNVYSDFFDVKHEFHFVFGNLKYCTMDEEKIYRFLFFIEIYMKSFVTILLYIHAGTWPCHFCSMTFFK